MRDCKECKGIGTVELMNCYNQSNECCGGCYKDVECDECNGTGNNKNWSDIEDEFSSMVKDWGLTKEELKTLIDNTNFKTKYEI